MPRTKLSAILYLLLVFVSGIVLGGFANHYYTAKASVLPASTAPRNMEEFRKRYMSEMQQRVGVTEAQETQIAKILDDTKKKFDELHKEERPRRDQLQQEQVDAIRAVLTKDQDAAYEAWRAERQKANRQQKSRTATSDSTAQPASQSGQ